MIAKKENVIPYYYLLVREDGVWDTTFGDYDKSVVEAERDDILEHFTPNGNSYSKKDFIIYTNRLPDTPYHNGRATNMAMDKCDQLNRKEGLINTFQKTRELNS